MLKRFIPFSFLLFLVFSLGAQRPSFVPVDMRVAQDASRMACDNNAGTCTQALAPLAQSNDKKYLCFKDKLNITHAKNQNLTSDPVKSTAAGVGYLFSTCQPTKTGPTIQNIAADPCSLKPIVPTAYGFSIYTGGTLKGDVEFFNDGYLQQTYNGNKPISLFFSPITYDKLSTPSVTYEGTPAGDCVHANINNAFEVVYLNEIKGTIVTQGNLGGSFKVIGGLSEYNNTTNYAITIVLKSNPAIKGTVTNGAAKHNGTVTFSVPENGTYSVNIEDGKSCGTAFEMVTSSAVDFSVENDTVCNGAIGSLLITPSGGVAGNYTYKWQKVGPSNPINGPFPLSDNGSMLTLTIGGNYSITVYDATGAASSARIGTVLQSSPTFGITLSGNVEIKCAGVASGNLTANVVGGFAPFYYAWSNQEQGSNKMNIVGLGAGPYSVTVTDNIGCSSTASTNITELAPMYLADVKNADATCIGAKDGQVRFDIDGGQKNPGGNYQSFDFSWNDGKNTFTSTDALGGFLPNADPGDYKITVTDFNGCKFTTSIQLMARRELSSSSIISDAKCFGQKDGSFTLSVTQKGLGSNSTSALAFSWTPNPSALTPLNTAFMSTYVSVGVGLYKVTITDPQYKCVITDSVRVKQPASALDVKIKTKSDPTCAGNSANGQIEIIATGGTPSYGFKWDKSNSITSSASNLIAGTYTITVSDGNGCSQVVMATLNDPPGPKVTGIQVKNVNCFTDTNGSIKITATPANAADVLTYKWSNNTATTPEISNLKPGAYTVTVTDPKGCAIIRDTVVKSPPLLELVGLAAITKPSCPGTADGKVELTIQGGTPKYTYNWKKQTGETGSKDNLDGPSILIEGLKIGIYDITITDQNNCPGLVIPLTDVTTPPVITLTKVLDKDVDCFLNSCTGKATVTVTAGNSPTGSYNFAWQTASFGTAQINEPVSADNLCKGWNKVTVSDTRCDYVDSIFVGSPTAITYDTTSLQVVNVSCFGQSDGSITVSGKGGTGPYTYNWLSPTSNSPSIKDLVADDYILTIKDNKNCEFITTITVSEPPPLVVTIEKIDSAKCNNSKDGKITLKATGGNDAVAGQAKYTFTWPFNVSTAATADKLGAGTYSITVTDSKGCAVTKDTILGQPSAVEFTLDTIVAPTCNGYSTEVKLKSASGGHGSQLSNYALVVNDQELPRGVSAQLGGGKHRINVVDPEGCRVEKDLDIEIQEPPRIRVYLGKDVELELGDSHDIDAVIEFTVPIAKYNWSATPGSTPLTFSDTCKFGCAQVIKPLVDGSYILQVEDSVGCIGIDTLNISIDRNRNVFIPNIFSPNVDGTNDFFEVFADNQSVDQINYLRVYDRWGTMIFESPSFKPQDSRTIGNRWNGYYKDGEANIGVYVYACEVKFIDGVVLVFRGDVMLAR